MKVYPGHTRDLQAVIVRSGGRTAVIPATWCRVKHLSPWDIGYDLYPLESIDNKHRFYDVAIPQQWLVVFTHDHERLGHTWNGRKGTAGGAANSAEGGLKGAALKRYLRPGEQIYNVGYKRLRGQRWEKRIKRQEENKRKDEAGPGCNCFREERHKLDLRSVELPARPKPMKAGDIRALRERLNASQALFARLLNVSSNAVESWEQGVRQPRQATLKLLRCP